MKNYHCQSYRLEQVEKRGLKLKNTLTLLSEVFAYRKGPLAISYQDYSHIDPIESLQRAE